MKVHASGAQDGIHLVPICPGKPALIHAVLSLQMTNAWLDGGSSFHPPPQAFSRTTAPSFGHVNLDVAGHDPDSPCLRKPALADRLSAPPELAPHSGCARHTDCHGTLLRLRTNRRGW